MFFYYAGHGIQTNVTKAVCNEGKPYPLEGMLRNMSTTGRSFIVGILDCCRSQFKETHRGAEGNDVVEESDKNNFVILFGCPPSSTTPAKSTISKAYFERLYSKMDKATCITKIPNAINGWRGTDNRAEVLSLTET